MQPLKSGLDVSSLPKPLKILHVPVDLGGHSHALAAAQRALGHEAICVTLVWSELGFNGDECFDSPVGTRWRLLKREWSRWTLLIRSLIWSDVIHCHFGQTILSARSFPLVDPTVAGFGETLKVAYARLLWLRDIALWSLFRKCVVMTFYCDDIRLVSSSISRNPWTHLALPGLREMLEPRDPYKRQLIAALEHSNITIFVTNPDLLGDAGVGAAFLPYGHVDATAYKVSPPQLQGPIRFVHLPTNRDTKGTSLFIAAVDQLKAEGVACELSIIENVSNTEALRAIAEHDVLLDQLRVGWYGGVAVEAMAMGKPVICYLNPLDIAQTPEEFQRDIPIVQANPDDILAQLRRIAGLERSELQATGMRGRRFIERWHNPEAIGKHVVDSYMRRLGQLKRKA